jgi:hypothetical protein
MFCIYFIGFECLFNCTFIDVERLSFENLIEFYLLPIENDNVFDEIKICNQQVNIKSKLNAFELPKK